MPIALFPPTGCKLKLEIFTGSSADRPGGRRGIRRFETPKVEKVPRPAACPGERTASRTQHPGCSQHTSLRRIRIEPSLALEPEGIQVVHVTFCTSSDTHTPQEES
jgi:hypothetical protein